MKTQIKFTNLTEQGFLLKGSQEILKQKREVSGVCPFFHHAMTMMLGIWLIASTLIQIPFAPFQQLRRWDRLGLLPEWKFFAPTPGSTDFLLFYRDLLADGRLTDWTEIPLVATRHWSHLLWNPGKRQWKAFYGLIGELSEAILSVKESPELRLKDLQETVSYRGLLIFAAFHLSHHATSRFTQIRVMMHDELLAQPSSMILQSTFHRLM